MSLPDTAPSTAQARSGFQLRTFAPAWGAAVMGTSALSVALLAVGDGSVVEPATTAAARAMLLIAVVMAMIVLGATAARWIRFTEQARADLRHPVKGGMTATAAGGLLTLALALGRVGPGFLPAALVEPILAVLVVVGAALALVIAWEFLAEMFTTEQTALAHISGAWFVPPVVTIIVPLAMMPLIAAHPGNAVNLLVVAWAFLGVGAVLYLVVTAALFIRSISHPLPPAGLAPTLFIGTGPAGLLGLDLLRLTEAGNKVGVAGPELVAATLPTATMLWGFGLWWMVSAMLVLRRGYAQVPFTLSWWGFTFPLAAWTLATIALGQSWEAGLLSVLGWIATAALAVLWTWVAARTLIGIRNGSVWVH